MASLSCPKLVHEGEEARDGHSNGSNGNNHSSSSSNNNNGRRRSPRLRGASAEPNNGSNNGSNSLPKPSKDSSSSSSRSPSRSPTLNLVRVKRAEKPHGAEGNKSKAAIIRPYKMTSRPRGLALIVEMEKYVNDVMDFREGSKADYHNLKQLFEQLHFKVIHVENPDYARFRNSLLSFSHDPAHSSADMAVVCVLGHGTEGGVFAADGVKVEAEKIYEYLNNEGCPDLRGKPKLFIMQACRGELKDKSWFSALNPSNIPVGRALNLEEPSSKKRRKRSRTKGDSNTANKKEEEDEEMGSQHSQDLDRARPTWEDIIIAYSTIPRYQAHRDLHDGSWFVQSLVESFSAHAHECDLVDLLHLTSRRLRQFENEEGDAQTCNWEVRNVYKRVFFNPGLPVLTGEGPPSSEEESRPSSPSILDGAQTDDQAELPDLLQ